MRQTLLRIPLDLTVNLFGMSIPIFGFGLLLLVWVGLSAFWAYRHWKQRGNDPELQGQLMAAGVVSGLIMFLPWVIPAINIFGYGFAMVCGFLAAAWLAGIRAKRENMDPALMWDVGIVVLLSGVIGARLFFIAQNPADFFGRGQNLAQFLFSIVNLPQGGLVLYGGVILGIFTYIWYCRHRHLSALKIADIVIPSIFVGEMFGRIGCFLNGCCYGAQTNGWWAVYFPPGSVPYAAEVAQKLIPPTATCSLPLHPAQLYSSSIALVLAIITWNYYPHRSRNGSVLLLGWVLYPIARFCIELVRNDTPPEVHFGIALTNAQWVSICMLIGAAGFAWFLSRRPKLSETQHSSHLAPQNEPHPQHNITRKVERSAHV